MATTAPEILHILEENAPAIGRYGVRSLGLFGSAARGAAREGSDLDFVVEFDSKTVEAYMDLKAFLERLLGHRGDLVLRDAIKPRLRERVLSEALHAPGFQGLPRRHPVRRHPEQAAELGGERGTLPQSEDQITRARRLTCLHARSQVRTVASRASAVASTRASGSRRAP